MPMNGNLAGAGFSGLLVGLFGGYLAGYSNAPEDLLTCRNDLGACRVTIAARGNMTQETLDKIEELKYEAEMDDDIDQAMQEEKIRQLETLVESMRQKESEREQARDAIDQAKQQEMLNLEKMEHASRSEYLELKKVNEDLRRQVAEQLEQHRELQEDAELTAKVQEPHFIFKALAKIFRTTPQFMFKLFAGILMIMVLFAHAYFAELLKSWRTDKSLPAIEDGSVIKKALKVMWKFDWETFAKPLEGDNNQNLLTNPIAWCKAKLKESVAERSCFPWTLGALVLRGRILKDFIAMFCPPADKALDWFLEQLGVDIDLLQTSPLIGQNGFIHNAAEILSYVSWPLFSLCGYLAGIANINISVTASSEDAWYCFKIVVDIVFSLLLAIVLDRFAGQLSKFLMWKFGIESIDD